MKYIYSTSQMSKLSLTLRTFSITGSVAGLFLTIFSILFYLLFILFCSSFSFLSLFSSLFFLVHSSTHLSISSYSLSLTFLNLFSFPFFSSSFIFNCISIIFILFPCYIQVYPSGNYIPVVKSPPNIQAHLSCNTSYGSTTTL